MKVKLTLHRTATEPTDVVITADSTATVEDVARQIALADPARTIPFGESDDADARGRPADRAVARAARSPTRSSARRRSAPGSTRRVVNLGADGRSPRRSRRQRPRGRSPCCAPIAGPLAGQEFPLGRGHATIGRDAGERHRARRPARLEAARPHRGRRPHRARRPQLGQRRARRRRSRVPAARRAPVHASRSATPSWPSRSPARSTHPAADPVLERGGASCSTAARASRSATRAPRSRPADADGDQSSGSSRGRCWCARSSWPLRDLRDDGQPALMHHRAHDAAHGARQLHQP